MENANPKAVKEPAQTPDTVLPIHTEMVAQHKPLIPIGAACMTLTSLSLMKGVVDAKLSTKSKMRRRSGSLNSIDFKMFTDFY